MRKLPLSIFLAASCSDVTVCFSPVRRAGTLSTLWLKSMTTCFLSKLVPLSVCTLTGWLISAPTISGSTQKPLGGTWTFLRNTFRNHLAGSRLAERTALLSLLFSLWNICTKTRPLFFKALSALMVESTPKVRNCQGIKDLFRALKMCSLTFCFLNWPSASMEWVFLWHRQPHTWYDFRDTSCPRTYSLLPSFETAAFLFYNQIPDFQCPQPGRGTTEHHSSAPL